MVRMSKSVEIVIVAISRKRKRLGEDTQATTTAKWPHDMRQESVGYPRAPQVQSCWTLFLVVHAVARAHYLRGGTSTAIRTRPTVNSRLINMNWVLVLGIWMIHWTDSCTINLNATYHAWHKNSNRPTCKKVQYCSHHKIMKLCNYERHTLQRCLSSINK